MFAIPSRKHRFGGTRSGYRDERGLIMMDIFDSSRGACLGR
jgi:hypothetical protein